MKQTVLAASLFAPTISMCLGSLNCAISAPPDGQQCKPASQSADKLQSNSVTRTNLREIHKQISALYDQGKLKEAEPLMRRYVQGIESSASDPVTLSQTYSSYAVLLGKLHKPAEAQQIALKAQKAKARAAEFQSKAALYKAIKNSTDRVAAESDPTTGVIGIKFIIANGDAPTIAQVFKDTPADKGGLKVGDQLVAVNATTTTGLSKEELYDLIIGTPGTDVEITVKRGSNAPVTAKLTRVSSERFPDTLRDTYRKNR